MGDHYDKLVVRYLFEYLHYLHAGGRIKRAGRLVGKNDIRVVDKSPGNRHSLHLSAGKLVGLLMYVLAQTHVF